MTDESRIERLLVVCLEDKDVLSELEPALNTLQEALPGTSVTLLASEAVPAAHPADEVLIYRASPATAGADPKGTLALVEELRRRRFDAAVILTRPGRSPYLPAFACYLAGVPRRLGQSVEFGGGVLSDRLEPDQSNPALQGLARRAALKLLAGTLSTGR